MGYETSWTVERLINEAANEERSAGNEVQVNRRKRAMFFLGIGMCGGAFPASLAATSQVGFPLGIATLAAAALVGASLVVVNGPQPDADKGEED